MGRKKTSAGITLVIPARGREPLLQQTVDHAVRTAGCEVDVIVVDNGLEGLEPVGKSVAVVRPEIAGTSAARHFGVQLARTELVVTVDAHVRLDRCWGLNIVQTFDDPAWHQTVACGHVGHLAENFEPKDEPCYHGARLNWMDTSAEPRALVARWDAHARPGARIGAVMGAFYAFRRDWYDAMCQPWKLNRSWGCDEELISIASYLSGGDCRLLPEDCRAWHLFRPASISYAPAEFAEIRANRLRLLRLFPFTSWEREDLCRFMRCPVPGLPSTEAEETFRACYEDARDRLEKYLAADVTGYAPWAETAAALPPAEPAGAPASEAPAAQTPPRPPPQRLPPRPADVCDQCDGRNTFLVDKTQGTIIRYKCSRCGRKAWRVKDGAALNFCIKND